MAKQKKISMAEALKTGKRVGNKFVVKDAYIKEGYDSDIIDKGRQIYPDSDEDYIFVEFDNCVIEANISAKEFYSYSLSFNNCEFKKVQNIWNGCSVYVTNCKFEDRVEIAHVNSVRFNNCSFKGHELYIEFSETTNINGVTGPYQITVDHCAYDVAVERCSMDYLAMYGNNLGDVDIKSNTVKKIRISSSKISNLTCRGNLYSQEISEFYLHDTIIADELNMAICKIKSFMAEHSMLIGSFRYTPDNIGKFKLNNSVGFVPPSNTVYLYKKCRLHDGNGNVKPIIVKLEVPATAKRVYCDTLKIRVSEAKVIGFYKVNGTEYKPTKKAIVRSIYEYKFTYGIGEVVKPKDPFAVSSGCCGSGIHGFMSFEDAVHYND